MHERLHPMTLSLAYDYQNPKYQPVLLIPSPALQMLLVIAYDCFWLLSIAFDCLLVFTTPGCTRRAAVVAVCLTVGTACARDYGW